MSRTKRRLPYSYLRKMKGHIAALRKGCRKGAVPPDPWADEVYSQEAKAPWRMAWRMGKHGHSANEIANQIHKTFDVPYLRALDIGRLVKKRIKERK